MGVLWPGKAYACNDGVRPGAALAACAAICFTPPPCSDDVQSGALVQACVAVYFTPWHCSSAGRLPRPYVHASAGTCMLGCIARAQKQAKHSTACASHPRTGNTVSWTASWCPASLGHNPWEAPGYVVIPQTSKALRLPSAPDPFRYKNHNLALFATTCGSPGPMTLTTLPSPVPTHLLSLITLPTHLLSLITLPRRYSVQNCLQGARWDGCCLSEVAECAGHAHTHTQSCTRTGTKGTNTHGPPPPGVWATVRVEEGRGQC